MIEMMKKDNGLVPINSSGNKFVGDLEQGQIVTVEVKKIRNYQQIKMAWAICDLIAQNARQEGYEALDSKRKVMEAIKLKLHYIDYYFTLPDKSGNQRVHVKTKSISYGKMSQDEWQKFLEEFLVECEKISQASKQDILENYGEYDADVSDDR
jgi:hypothetical protein